MESGNCQFIQGSLLGNPVIELVRAATYLKKLLESERLYLTVRVIESAELVSFQLPLREISEWNSSLASQSIPSWNRIIFWLKLVR